ncbi:PAS domain-containing serine threonine- kinase [Brachionus plicatilis]|uniref:PAS domain-containing serine threonine-kinase n=1 Tax=Brachionus plicatilis TaxID=10195 RepID=A0A3M7P5B5_BRAPC|nr:PAS domain-containing serine threonine- kinase [Brachionus plicatilis]
MKNSKVYDISGSPGFGSPTIDILRNGRRERAAQFGLNDENEESFECNQSFPKVFAHQNKNKHPNNFSPDLNRYKGCDLNSVSFLKNNLIKNLNTSRRATQNAFNDTGVSFMNASYLSTTADKSWFLYNQFLNTNSLIPSNIIPEKIITVNNPNKALLVINGRTTEILTANNISCDLFGFTEEKLIGMYLKNLLDLNDESDCEKNQEILMESDRLDQNGRVVLCSGKIFDAVTNNNCHKNEDADLDAEADKRPKIPISMFMQKLTDESEPKCLCVMEPIQRIVGSFSINVKGRIKHYNSNFSYIFGFTNLQGNNHPEGPSSLSAMSASSVLNGKEITELIPSMKIPMSSILKEHRKQPLTGRSLQGENIPMTIKLSFKMIKINKSIVIIVDNSDPVRIKKNFSLFEVLFNCSVNVYTNISGLITVRASDFKINSYNSTFSRFLFGYDEKELLEKNTTKIKNDTSLIRINNFWNT